MYKNILKENGLPNEWDFFSSSLQILRHGWFPTSHQHKLAKIIEDYEIKNALEIGAWLGESTIFLAQRLELVVSIDTWEGSDAHKDGTYGVSIDNKSNIDSLSLLKEQFLTNCEQYKKTICPIQMDSRNLNQIKLPMFDLIYIDGEHQYDFVKNDIEISLSLIKPGGIICGDDYCDSWPGVSKAVNELILDFRVDQGFWWSEG